MEQGARAIIEKPGLLLPLFIGLLVLLLVVAPQLLVLLVIATVVVLRRRAKAHRFDTYVAEMLKE